MTPEGREINEIRLLGPLRVRRVDGSWVDPGEWRTRKARDLLRILALRAGRPTPADTLVEALWPAASVEQGRTSLRTAASQIRKALRSDCIERLHGGLVLRNVWVDTHRFRALVDECRHTHADGNFAAALTAARSGEFLYIHDIDVGDEGDDVSIMERDALRRARVSMLDDAASSALALHRVPDAVDFAERALTLDPYSEQACRTAMLAFQQAGEIERALTVYQECKTHLVEELGVDPSAQTQNLYLELLRTEPADPAASADLDVDESSTDVDAGWGRQRLAHLHENLTGPEITLLEVLAVVDSSLNAREIAAVLGMSDSDPEGARAEIEAVLTRLEELAVLSAAERGRYLLRAKVLRDTVGGWMRPGARRKVHRSAAERLTLPIPARVHHWIEAGEPGLACAAAMDGAVEAMHECDFAVAAERLHQVLTLIDDDTASPEDRLDIVHRLAVCSDRLGRHDDAARFTGQARELADAHGLGRPTDPASTAESTAPDIPLTASPPAGRPDRPSILDRLGITTATSPTDEVAALLRDMFTLAESRHDEETALEARLLLAGLVLVPRRNFAEARRVLAEVIVPPDSVFSLAALLAQVEAGVLLGDPSVDMSILAYLAQTATSEVGLTSGLSAGVLNAWALHDRGDPNAEKVCEEAIADAEAQQLPGPWRFAVARILAQRGEVSRARGLVDGAPWRVGGPTAQILALRGRAELAVAEGDPGTAASHLMRGAEIAQRTRATLLLPDVTARLVMGGDEDDEESLLEYLDLAELATGEATTGREQVMIMLARAAIRAIVGRTLSAAALAGAAAELASSLGLVYCAAEATTRRAGYLDAAGATAGVTSTVSVASGAPG